MAQLPHGESFTVNQGKINLLFLLKKDADLKYLCVFALVLLQVSGQGQNLIERTKLGLAPSHNLPPNRIFSKTSHHKSVEVYRPWSFSNLKNGQLGRDIILDPSKEMSHLHQFAPAQMLLEVPVTTSAHFSLTLERIDLFTDRDHGDVFTYQGYVTDDPNSIASMAVSKEEMTISISDSEGTYRINRPKGAKVDLLFKDDPVSPSAMSCGTTDDRSMVLRDQVPVAEKRPSQKADGDMIEVYVECDYQLFLDKGSVTAVEQYVTTLFNEVSTLYANEDITLRVSDIKVWTSADPYRNLSLGNVINILQTFGRTVKDNYDGRLAALLIGRVPSSTGVGGIAWVDVLCNSYWAAQDSGPYSINYGFGRFTIRDVPQYSLDVSILTHELGHNVGSPHTHSCEWGPSKNRAIDNCASNNCILVQNPTPPSDLGTIMSYCNNVDFNKGFGTEPGNLIRNRYQSANCLVRDNGGDDGGDTPENCTHTTRTYSNIIISNGEKVRANNVNFFNTVRISTNATVDLSAAVGTSVYGTLEIPRNSILEIQAKDCN